MNRKTIITIIVIAAIVGAVVYLDSQKTEISGEPQVGDVMTKNVSTEAEFKRSKYEPGKEISTSDGFINTTRIVIGEQIGKKVVLVDFWTYSCINCQRTIPYLNAWWEKYKDKGLVIIGVHTPEFEFEKKYENVKAAVEKFAIKYPVVLDNDYSTWTAYKNRYWPRKYLIDIDGYIVYDHIGEGGYEETEKKIQELLSERMSALNEKGEIGEAIAKPDADSVDPSQKISPEVYFGATRNELLANGKPGQVGVQKLILPEDIKTNALYLEGNWNIQNEFATNTGPVKVVFKYRAKNVFMVAGAERPIGIRVLRDGKTLVDNFYGDSLSAKDEMLYRLVEGDNYGEHTLELIITEPGLKVFTFTFG